MLLLFVFPSAEFWITFGLYNYSLKNNMNICRFKKVLAFLFFIYGREINLTPYSWLYLIPWDYLLNSIWALIGWQVGKGASFWKKPTNYWPWVVNNGLLCFHLATIVTGSTSKKQLYTSWLYINLSRRCQFVL